MLFFVFSLESKLRFFTKIKEVKGKKINTIKIIGIKIPNILVAHVSAEKKERKNIFINWAKKQNNYSIRVIPIEIGISASKINKMSSKKYFHPQDISKALSPWEVNTG